MLCPFSSCILLRWLSFVHWALCSQSEANAYRLIKSRIMRSGSEWICWPTQILSFEPLLTSWLDQHDNDGGSVDCSERHLRLHQPCKLDCRPDAPTHWKLPHKIVRLPFLISPPGGEADLGRGDALALNFIIIWFFGDVFSFFGYLQP